MIEQGRDPTYLKNHVVRFFSSGISVVFVFFLFFFFFLCNKLKASSPLAGKVSSCNEISELLKPLTSLCLTYIRRSNYCVSNFEQ